MLVILYFISVIKASVFEGSCLCLSQAFGTGFSTSCLHKSSVFLPWSEFLFLCQYLYYLLLLTTRMTKSLYFLQTECCVVIVRTTDPVWSSEILFLIIHIYGQEICLKFRFCKIPSTLFFVSVIKWGNCVRYFATVAPTELWRISSSGCDHDYLPDELTGIQITYAFVGSVKFILFSLNIGILFNLTWHSGLVLFEYYPSLLFWPRSIKSCPAVFPFSSLAFQEIWRTSITVSIKRSHSELREFKFGTCRSDITCFYLCVCAAQIKKL